MSDSISNAIAEIEAAPKIKMGRNRSYTQVADRVVAFRKHFDPTDWGIVTDVVNDNGEVIVMKAHVIRYDAEGDRIIATGYAEEVRGSSNINKPSALENAETSAIGRALAALALHGGEFASAGEVANAVAEQQKPKAAEESVNKLLQVLRDANLSDGEIEEYRKSLRIARWGDLTEERTQRLLEKMRSKLAREYAEGEAASDAIEKQEK